MTQDELIAQVKADTEQVVKIGTETRTLLDKIKELLDLLANQTLKPEVEAAVSELSAQVAVVDELVPRLSCVNASVRLHRH